MKRTLFCVLLFSFAISASAQENISLNNLESLFFANNPSVKAKKAELKVFDGRKLDAKQRSNPSLNTSVESLSNGSRETETSVSLSQELDLNNKRRWLVRSLQHAKNAQAFQLAFEFRDQLTQLKKIFCKSVLLEKDVYALNDVLQTVQDIEEKSQARLALGDVSEVDVMRLSAEKQKVLLLIDTLKNEAEFEKKSLAISLGLATGPVLIDSELPLLKRDYEPDVLNKLAIENRADLKASQEKLLAGENLIVAAKKEIKSPVTVEGGYKARNGGFNGFILGISTPLPITNRNQGKIQELIAGREAEKLHVAAVENNLSRSLEVAVEKLAYLSGREQRLSQQIGELEKIVKIARFNFEEGEAGLIEILDAVRNQSDLILELNRTIMESWFVVFDLENLTGSNLTIEGASQ